MTTMPNTPTKRARAVKRASRGQRPHNAAATMKLITDATIRLLAEKGFPGIGVNTVAAAAGVDKQLIYYHFGGLEGVIRQLGSQLEFWLGTPLQARPGEPYGDSVHRLLMEYAGALRRNPLVLRLLAWELVEPTDVLKELEVNRSAAMSGWVQDLRAVAQPAPEGIDAPAVNAVLLAGLHYLALREKSLGSFAGLDIQSAEGMARVAKAVRLITQRVYATAPVATSAAQPAGAARLSRPSPKGRK
jgi:AcrR family transcriptional regulator